MEVVVGRKGKACVMKEYATQIDCIYVYYIRPVSYTCLDSMKLGASRCKRLNIRCGHVPGINKALAEMLPRTRQ